MAVPNWTYVDGSNEPVVNYTYVGATLDDREYNGYDDSDFYAVVWDEEKQSLRRVDYGSTRFPSPRKATVDATPEVREKAREWLKNWLYEASKERELKAALKPELGKEVTVTGGRKRKGETGTVMWKGERKSKYGTWSYGWRYGVRFEDGSVLFFDDKNLSVDPVEYMPSFEQLRARAESYARDASWVVWSDPVSNASMYGIDPPR